MRARQLDAILTIAYRDVLKFLRDPIRIVASFAFPVIFVVVLGGSLQGNLGEAAGYNFLVFTFTGVLAQTVFQSAALGLVSMIEDRENDFSQEVFVAPISRYAIVFGKIAGEALVALAQGLGLVVLALLLRVPLSPAQLLALLAAAVVAALHEAAGWAGFLPPADSLVGGIVTGVLVLVAYCGVLVLVDRPLVRDLRAAAAR